MLYVLLVIGSSEGIRIHAVFVSNTAGEILKKYARGEDDECCIITSEGEAAWNVLIISVLSLAVIVAVLLIIFIVGMIWREKRIFSCLVGGNLVDSLPCFTFSAARISGYMGETCAICLETYRDGETLKLLPCQHSKSLAFVTVALPWRFLTLR